MRKMTVDDFLILFFGLFGFGLVIRNALRGSKLSPKIKYFRVYEILDQGSLPDGGSAGSLKLLGLYSAYSRENLFRELTKNSEDEKKIFYLEPVNDFYIGISS